MAKRTRPPEPDGPAHEGSVGGYTSSAVCMALGLPRTTYDAWMLRGYLHTRGPGTGRSRLVDVATIVRLAVMVAGVDAGVSLRKSVNCAEIALSLLRDGLPYRYLIAQHYGNDVVYVPADDGGSLSTDPVRPCPTVEIKVDVARVVGAALTALEGKPTPIKFVLDHFAAEAQSARAGLKQFLDDTDRAISEAKQTKLAEPAPTPKKARRSRVTSSPKE